MMLFFFLRSHPKKILSSSRSSLIFFCRLSALAVSVSVMVVWLWLSWVSARSVCGSLGMMYFLRAILLVSPVGFSLEDSEEEPAYDLSSE